MPVNSMISRIIHSPVARDMSVNGLLGLFCGGLFGVVFGGFGSMGTKTAGEMTVATICLGLAGGVGLALIGLLTRNSRAENLVTPVSKPTVKSAPQIVS